MVRPGVWLVVGKMKREIAIISTDQATTPAAAAAAPSRRAMFLQQEPLSEGHT
jgi:hypothetical protein